MAMRITDVESKCADGLFSSELRRCEEACLKVSLERVFLDLLTFFAAIVYIFCCILKTKLIERSEETQSMLDLFV